MSQYFDVVILGGGVIGCATAYQMAKKGAKVMVVEKRTVGGQASSVAAGMLATQEEATAPDAFFDMCRASRALFDTWVPEVRETSGVNPEYEPCGVWRVAETEEEKKALLEKQRWQEEKGFPVEWQEPERLEDIHPGLGECLGALHCRTDGQINSSQWVHALAEASRRKGVRFLDHVASVEFVRDGRRVAGVRTKEDLIAADHVLLAAGAWTSFLLDALGISLPLEPVKGQLMVLGGMPRAFKGPVYAGKGYLVPRSDGRLVIGTTVERVGFDVRATLEAQRQLADWATRWCPGLSSLPVVEFQVGLRPGTPDGWPVMGRLWDYDNLFVSTGHFRNGILLSPFAGRYMADGVLDNRWNPLGAAFSPERFHHKETPS